MHFCGLLCVLSDEMVENNWLRTLQVQLVSVGFSGVSFYTIQSQTYHEYVIIVFCSIDQNCLVVKPKLRNKTYKGFLSLMHKKCIYQTVKQYCCMFTPYDDKMSNRRQTNLPEYWENQNKANFTHFYCAIIIDDSNLY